MKYRIILPIIIGIFFIFLSGCMSSTSSGVTDFDGSSQRSDEAKQKITVSGKITAKDSTVSLSGIEIYFVKKSDISDEQEDDNIQRVSLPSQYKYKALTNIEGSFSISDFETGIYDITVIKQNYSSLEIKGMTITSSQNNIISAELSIPSKLAGTVLLSNGVTRYGIKVYIGNSFYLTSENGSFSASLAPGTYEIIIDEYGYERLERTVVIENNVDYNAGVFNLVKSYVNPDLGMLRGKAITSYGISIPCADIMLMGTENIEYHTTTSTGTFDIPNLDPGNYILRIINGYYSTDVSVELEAGSITDIENIVVDNISKNSIVEIIFQNAEDIERFSDISVFQGTDKYDCVIIKAEESVFIKGLKDGYFNIVMKSDYFEDMTIDINSEPGEDITLEALPEQRKSVFSGFIKDITGNRVCTDLRFDGKTYVADEQGNFLIEDITAGTYSLNVSAFGYQDFSDNIVIETGVDKTGYQITLSGKQSSGIYDYVNTGFIVEKAVEYGENIILLSQGRFYMFSKKDSSINLLSDTGKVISDFMVEEGAVYALDVVNDEILKISASSGDIKWNAACGIEPFRILRYQDEIIAFSRGDRKFHIFELDTGNFIAQFDTGFDVFDASCANDSLFMADKYNNRIVSFDLVNRLFGSTITNITKPVALFSVDGRLIVKKEFSAELDVYNVSNHVRITGLNPGMNCEDIISGNDRIYSVSDTRVTVYNKNSLGIEKLEDIMSGMKSVIEDSDNSQKLFIFEKNSQRITVYFCK